MKISNIFIIVPSIVQTGPVKGAIALGNGLIEYLPVTMISLKQAHAGKMSIDPRVQIVSLEKRKNWFSKVRYLKEYFRMKGKKSEIVSISFCFSSDAVNFWLKDAAQIISSVRGNLPQNYKYEYGVKGLIAAYIHLLALNRFDHIMSMSDAMTKQLKRWGIRKILQVGNFIDEKEIIPSAGIVRKKGPIRFVFVGSLTKRKKPELLIDIMAYLIGKNIESCLDIVGDGPLKGFLENKNRMKGQEKNIIFHGQLKDPYSIIERSDYMILPSESEGISRAVLEALFLGVPCILRDIDANKELIRTKATGILFKKDAQLYGIMEKLSTDIDSIRKRERKNLLPCMFQMEPNIKIILRYFGLWKIKIF